MNMSPKYEAPLWASLGIDMATNIEDRLAAQRLIREIYNPMIYDTLQRGRAWNTTFAGYSGFEIRRRLAARQHELPATVLAHVQDPAELTERMFDILRYYRFTNPAWRVANLDYPIVEIVPLPAPAGGLAPRPGPGFFHPPAPAPAPAPTPARNVRLTRARTRALAPSPAPTSTLVPTRDRTIAPAASPNSPPAPVLPVRPIPKAATEDISGNSGEYPIPVGSPLSTPSFSPPLAPFIQPSIDPIPDFPLIVAPEDLHSHVLDEPHDDYLISEDIEALPPSPSPPRTDLDIPTSTIERGNRKRARDDENDGQTSPPQKKRSRASQLPKEKVDWRSFTTLSDSSSNDEEILDADGDTWMGESYKPYKIENKSVEPDSGVWSTMREYFLHMAREPTPHEQDEEQDEEQAMDIGE